MYSIMKTALDGIDADYADIRIERSETTSLTYMGPVVEDIGTTFALGGCVRVCTRGGWGFASFNRIEEAAESAKAASVMAELAAGDTTRLAPVKPVTARIPSEAAIDPAEISLDEKRGLLAGYNGIMLADDGIVTTKAVYRDTKKTVWLKTTEGTELEREMIYAGVMLLAVAKDGANVQRGFRSIGDRRGYETVLNLESEAEAAVKTARDLITAPKVTGGVYPVILDPLLAGVFTHEAFGHLSEADFVYENPKAMDMMKLGRRFGPDNLNIIDDGGMSGENGYIGYDDEGVPKGGTYLIRDGVLTGRLHSRETAGRLGENPTGNARAITYGYRPIVRMTSTFINRGDASFEEMLEGIEDGVYACGALGGMTDLERFTFSSMYAYRIENGKLTTPLRDVILSGNVFETLKNVDRIGNDLTFFGGLGGCGKGGQSPLPTTVGAPHVSVKNVLIG